jgi:predicted CopG family antitoxin
MPDYKNIKIHEDTHERLKSHGNMGESFDDLINRILDDWEEEEEKGGRDE